MIDSAPAREDRSFSAGLDSVPRSSVGMQIGTLRRPVKRTGLLLIEHFEPIFEFDPGIQ